MDANTVEAVVSRRFRLEHSPTLVSTAARTPIAFSRLRCERHNHGRAGSVPKEASFAFQVMLQPLQSWDVVTKGSLSRLPPGRAGDAFLFDLADNPRAAFHSPFDMMRFYLPQDSLDAFAHENGFRAIRGLRAPASGTSDLILYGTALALSGAMERPNEVQALFVDAVALSVQAHIIQFYGGASPLQRSRKGLAPWQLHRVTDAMESDLGTKHSIATLARDCSLSPDHFIRAFRRSTGFAPHQWLLRRRVERAKVLMRDTVMALPAIALECGFVDQSHLSRIFSRLEGHSPARWRQLLRV